MPLSQVPLVDNSVNNFNPYDDVMPEIVSSSSFGFSGDSRPQSSVVYGNDVSQVDKDFIFEGLKKLYQKKVLPLELATKYSHFGSPPLSPSDFEAKPMVLIMGQVRSAWRVCCLVDWHCWYIISLTVFCWQDIFHSEFITVSISDLTLFCVFWKTLFMYRQDFPGQRIGPEPTTDRSLELTSMCLKYNLSRHCDGLDLQR